LKSSFSKKHIQKVVLADTATRQNGTVTTAARQDTISRPAKRLKRRLRKRILSRRRFSFLL